MKSSRAGLYSLVAFMTFVWGVNYVAAKLALRWFPPLLFATMRAAVAAALLAPVYFWSRSRRPREEPWQRSGMLALALLGILGIMLNQVLFIVGMNATSVAHAALIVSLSPLLVLLLAAARGQERITTRKVAGLGVSVCGVLALQLVPGRLHGATGFGDLMIFAASAIFALFTVMTKETTARHDAVTVNSVGYAAGALAGLPVLVWQARGFDFAQVSVTAWGMLFYMALFPSVLCYLIYHHALRRIDASRVAAFSYAQPVIATLAGAVVLAEPLTLPVATGGALVLSGVWLTSRR